MIAVLTKEFLQKEYIEKKKSTYQIAEEIACSSVTIGRWLKKYEILRRNNTEALKGKHCSIKTEFKKGRETWNFKGEIKRNGYIVVYLPKHPYRSKQGYVRKHRAIVELKIGRYLNPKERVHHLNRVKTNNGLTNLIAFDSESAHQRFHYSGKNVKKEEIIFDGRKIK